MEIPLRTNEGLPTYAINRIPFGYTLYPTGIGDDLVNGEYGKGTELILDSNTKTLEFGLLNHFFLIGGEALWDGNAQIRDYVTASLFVPATNGTNGTGYNFTKQATGKGFNMYVPTSPGEGDWDLDIENPKFSEKELLKVNPVPVAGNTGFFDYDKENNKLIVNSNQKGGYNLYDVDIDISSFGRRLWGGPNRERKFKESGIVGKLLYSMWKLRLELSIHDEANRNNTPTSCINIVTAAKKNI